MSVLHIVDGRPCVCALAAERLRSTGGTAVLLGTASDVANARAAGLAPSASHAPPLGDPFLARRSIGSILRRASAALGGAIHVVAWSPAAAVLARRALGQCDITMTLADGAIPGVAEHCMRRWPSLRPSRAVALSDGIARRAAERLGIESAVEPVRWPTTLNRRDREGIRRRWGAKRHECVIGVLGEPADRVDAFRITELMGIAAVRREPVRLVVHPDAARRADTEAWMAEVDRESFVQTDRALERPWEIAAGLDVAIVLADGARVAGDAARGRGRDGLAVASTLVGVPMSPLPAACAAAAGVPVVVEEGALDDAFVERIGALPWRAADHLGATRHVVQIARRIATAAEPSRADRDAASAPLGATLR